MVHEDVTQEAKELPWKEELVVLKFKLDKGVIVFQDLK